MADDDWEFNWTTGDETRARAETPGPEPVAPLRVGDRFAGYLITELLGQGGMGTVFRATDLEAARDVALKVLHTRATPTQLARLRREGELTAALDHPGIVRVHAGGDVDGRPFLAYALVPDARPLDAAWEDLDRAGRVRLVLETARAVGHAHAHGIVHRDLKGENVLVDASGTPRVVDFGLARHVDHERLTQTGAVVGTPLGMAPEQFLAERGKVGPPTDVFALGILLYRALTDELPFEAGGWVELARAVSTGRLTPPRARDPSVPPELEAVVLTCLAVAPEDRYPDASALAHDLEAFLDGRPLSSASSWSRARQLARRPLRSLAAVGAASLLVLAVGLALTARWRLVQREGDLRRQVAALDPNDLAQRRALAERLAAPGDLPTDLRAAAERALADGAPRDVSGWEDRLEHARRAAKLAPSPAAAAREAVCLLALERPVEALEPLGRAASASPDDPHLRRRQVEALLQAGRPDEALALAGEDAALPLLRARALFAVGKRAEARALATRVARERPSVGAEVLVAELERGRDDVVGRLRGVVRVHPAQPVPRAALARAYLRLGAAGLAADALRGPPALAPAAALLALAATSPARAAAAANRAPGWRRPTVQYAVHAARRSLEWRRIALTPARREELTAEARRYLQLGRALLQPSWSEEQRALAALEARLPEPPPPTLSAAELQAATARFEALRDQQRDGAGPEAMTEAFRALYREYPAFHRAGLYVGKTLLLQAKKRPGFRACLAAIRRAPRLHRFFHADMRRVYDGRRFMPHQERDAEGPIVDTLDRLCVACERTLHFEQLGRHADGIAALVDLDQVLEAWPGDPVARPLRGFVLMRLGRLAQAEWDLTLAAAAAPRDAVTAYYRLLLWCALERPPKLLKAEVRHVAALGFVTWTERGWRAEQFPELGPLVGSPELRAAMGAR